jgi:DNA-directed RNA polymerase specialized sigma24 family protein
MAHFSDLKRGATDIRRCLVILAPHLCDCTAEALDRLQAQHKAILELRIEGYEVAGIAQKTGRSKRTVERILQEARDKLHDLLVSSLDMEQEVRSPERGDLDDFVRPFEIARAQVEQVDLMAFLPAPDHPLYHRVQRELIRVDLEYGWERDRPGSLEEYQQLFPELFRDPESVQEIAFEEYRLRQQAGDNPDPVEYEKRFGISTKSWTKADVPSGGPPEGLVDSATDGLAKALRGLSSLIANDGIIAEALARLPSHQKAVFELCVQGCEVAEIALKVGRSRRTVERLLQEIINKLIDLLGNRE